MKKLIFALLLIPGIAMAQKVNIKDVDASDEDTTVTISNGKKKSDTVVEETAAKAVWQTEEGKAQVEGEEALMSKEAVANWKKACETWKKEFKADNKDNKIISLDCGTKSCTNEATSKVCSSEAKYKIKTRMDQ